jgi:ribosomal protein L37AE/L43A
MVLNGLLYILEMGMEAVFYCPNCLTPSEPGPSAIRFHCKNCHYQLDAFQCSSCGANCISRAAGAKFDCPKCGKSSRKSPSAVPLNEVDEFLELAKVTEIKAGGRHSAVRSGEKRLGPFMVVDGAGWAPAIGSSSSLTIDESDFIIGTATVPLTDIVDLQVEGKSLTSGGGYMGGGFGVRGAAEGMLAAELLNRWTTKRHDFVIFSIVGRTGRVVGQINNANAMTVRNLLRPILDMAFALEQLTEEPAQTENQPPDLSVQLERLGTLHQNGLLSAGEFDAAKRKLLGI